MAKSLANLTDAELVALYTQAVDALGLTPANYGMTTLATSAISTAGDDFAGSVTAQQAAQVAAKTATQTKESKRNILIDLLRSFRSTAQGHGVSDAEMTATGMPKGSAELTPPSATMPVLSVDTSRQFQHDLSWAEATTPDNKKRPRGVMGADIYRKIDGPPPADASECNFVTTDSATPYLVDYTSDEAGKMAHYMVRWRFRDGSVGSWGETVSATITG